MDYNRAFTKPLDPDSPPPPPPQTSNLVKTFQISGDYCVPTEPGPKASTIQFLTHGLGYDRRYWDFYAFGSDNAQFSHVNAATSAGYSTVSFNRLGMTPSTVADPYTEVQALVHVDIMIYLTGLVRAGQLPGMISPPKKIVHVGHSFGSQLTMSMAALAPDITDGIVLTGLGNGEAEVARIILGTIAFRLANDVAADRFPVDTYSGGWLIWTTDLDNQFNFFQYPNFEPAVLETAEAIKHPFSIGELFAAGALPRDMSQYTKPVLYLASEKDSVCQFDCNEKLFAKDGPAYKRFSGSDDIEWFIQPGAGHALPLHTNVTEGYEVLDMWIAKRFHAE